MKHLASKGKMNGAKIKFQREVDFVVCFFLLCEKQVL